VFKKWLVVAACLAMCGCSTGSGKTEAVSGPAAAALQAAAEQDCPWPADVAHYEQTTLTARHARATAPDLGSLKAVPSGCAVLTFAVDEQGVVTNDSVVAASPASFARIGPEILRWNDYASGDSPMAVFMMRLGAQRLADGGALLSLAFKDSSFAILVPVSAGQ
jgi:hypothetical protein